jgi:hypothetical protein
MEKIGGTGMEASGKGGNIDKVEKDFQKKERQSLRAEPVRGVQSQGNGKTQEREPGQPLQRPETFDQGPQEGKKKKEKDKKLGYPDFFHFFMGTIRY